MKKAMCIVDTQIDFLVTAEDNFKRMVHQICNKSSFCPIIINENVRERCLARKHIINLFLFYVIQRECYW